MNTTADGNHGPLRLGSHIASLFAGIGLEQDIPELRSERGSVDHGDVGSPGGPEPWELTGPDAQLGG